MKRILLLFIMIPAFHILCAQGTIEDYKRAFSYSDRMKNKVYGSDVVPHWIGDTSMFWYVSNTPTGKVYTLVDAAIKSRTLLFDHLKLVESLSDKTGKEIKLEALSLQSVTVHTDLDTMTFVYQDHKWIYQIKKDILTNSGSVIKVKEPYWGTVDTEREGKPVTSPDRKSEALVKNHNLYVRDLKTGQERALSLDGTQEDYYSAYPYWSADSRKLAVMRIHGADVRKLYLIESSPTDQLQPRFHIRDYVKPGDKLPMCTPVIFDVTTGEQKNISTSLCREQLDLKGFEWAPDSRTVIIEYNQRGQQVYRVLEISAETGKVKPLIEEYSETFINYNRYYRNYLYHSNEIIWMSERDNYNHLYMYDNTGKLKWQITKGKWYVREVIHVDEAKREIIFSASGMVLGEDPYLVRYYRTGFDGRKISCLTPETGMHKAWFSADYRYFVDVYSLVNKAPVALLRETKTGKVMMQLEKADMSALLKQGWVAPEPFVAKGRDGQTDIWGIIIRPTNFDASKKYPVLEYIYASPGNQYTPKTFMPVNWPMSAVAELGFVVVQIDGMGTSFRSKAFEDVCFRNLNDAGLPDRIAWTKAAARKYGYIDTTRVGIFGASAGGQEAMAAVLYHPEHYKAAYAACGCHDNRLDKLWWNEQWLGYPVDKQYENNSNVVNAHLLTRPLMLVVGEMDDNVDPASTFQVCNALIKSNKDFELVMLPGIGHTMGENYGEHKRYDFFVKHLMGVTPPLWNELEK